MNLACLLLVAYLNLTITNVSQASRPPSSNYSLEKFLKCLPRHFSDPAHPIFKSIYTPNRGSTTSTFSAILQARVANIRFNRSTTPKPLAIVTATHYSHTQATVFCAKASGLQIRIRSGGHDFEGLSYVSRVPFVVLDMFELRKIDIDVAKETATVQSGAILGELYYAAATMSNNTLAFPGGVRFTVGVGGHFGAGGYGTLIRKFGLTIDHVVDAEVVDANGTILNRKTMGEDYFWAIRGGGAASFGVVLSWKIKLVRVPQIVSVFRVRRTLDQGATDIVDQWQRVGHAMDPNLFIRVQPRPFVDQKYGRVSVGVMFIALYLGRAESLVRLINRNIPLLGLTQDDVVEMTWAQSALYWALSSPKGTPLELMLNRTVSPATYFKNKSDFVKKPIPKQGWETIWKKMIELGPTVRLQLNTYGGRMSQIPENATPFPHRAGNLFKIQYMAAWSEESLEVEKARVAGIRSLYDTFAPYVSNMPREALLAYRDLDIGTNANKSNIGFAFDYFKGNVPRLLHVKAKVDPTDFFTYEQSIPLLNSKELLKQTLANNSTVEPTDI